MRQLRVGGVHLFSAGLPWGDLAWTTDERGCKDAAWSVHLRPGDRHPLLTRGALVEIVDTGTVVWAGFLDELNWAEGTFGAKGFAYEAERFMAADVSYVPTSTPSAAVDGAIARGWRVTRGSGIPSTPFAATADASQKVGALLDSSADELGHRWSVRADRVVRMAVDSTTPDWLIRPGLVELGNTSQEYASAIVVTYLDMGSLVAGTVRTDPAAENRFDVAEYPLDLTGLGPMTLARAEGYGDGILAKGRARLGWTTPIEVTANDLLTPGQDSADLSMVASGQVVRIFLGFDDVVALDGRTYLDVPIGSTSFSEASPDVLTISPVGSVAQTLSEAISELTESANAA